jgi:hypothetical protein
MNEWVPNMGGMILTGEKGSTAKPGYNDIGLYDTSPTASDILWYQLIPQC